MNEQNPFDGVAPRQLKLSRITALELLQVRKEYVHAPTVDQYASQIRNGIDLGPILVAQIERTDLALKKALRKDASALGGPVLVVVDGFHRLEAHLQLGRPTIAAKVVACGLAEAQWWGGQQNLSHGRQLRRGDYRRLFRAYIAARRYKWKDDDGEWQVASLRDIVRALGGGMAYTTVRLWLQQDYPYLFRTYWDRESPPKRNDGPTDGPTSASTSEAIGGQLRGLAKLATALAMPELEDVADVWSTGLDDLRKAIAARKKTRGDA